MMNSRVSAVIPAFNESAMLPVTLAALRRLDVIDEIVVVDDGSEDGSAAVARGAKTKVLRLDRNGGKGKALQAGVSMAGGDVLVLLDADLGDSAEEAHKLVAPVVANTADMVIGAFGAVRPAGFGIVQSIARTGIGLVSGLKVDSPLSGQRALNRRVLQAVPRFASGFGAEVALTIDAVRAGLRVMEVPVAMNHAETGRDWAGFVHRGRQLLHVAAALLPRLITMHGRYPTREGG